MSENPLREKVERSLEFWKSVLSYPDAHIEQEYTYEFELRERRKALLITFAEERIAFYQDSLKERKEKT